MPKNSNKFKYGPYSYISKNGDNIIYSILFWIDTGKQIAKGEITTSSNTITIPFTVSENQDCLSEKAEFCGTYPMDLNTKVKITCKVSENVTNEITWDLNDPQFQLDERSSCPENGILQGCPHIFLTQEVVDGGVIQMQPYLSIRTKNNSIPKEIFTPISTIGLSTMTISDEAGDKYYYEFKTSDINTIYSAGTSSPAPGFFRAEVYMNNSLFSKGKIKNANSDGTGGN